jgi:predicted CXXCH cytochrome family protein
MSKINLLKILFIKTLLFLLILHFFAVSAYSFTSSEEYLSHAQGFSTCTTQKCHADITKQRKQYVHEPIISGKCSACHKAEVYPHKYGIEPNQRKTCENCHKKTERKFLSKEFIHSPVKNGDCTSCHDPHESDYPFIMRNSFSALCKTCHNVKALFTGRYLHKPVKDGNCGLCHEPHASNNKARLIDSGANLCVLCHHDMITGMTQNYVHKPILESGCNGCHDSHSGTNKFRLTASAEQMCFTCHKDKENEINQYTKKHEPASSGQCITCHSPHYSEMKYLLLDDVDTLCYKCHKKNITWKERRFLHGPILQGNCSACHNPHGSDNAYILRLSFPQEFYARYEKGTYALCFLCHKEALISEKETENITYFRNGNMNLHTFHVKQEKGRTCRACHDVHASDLEHHLREEFLFGTISLPLFYSKTETGGSCLPGCHRKRGYDRVNRVQNDDTKRVSKSPDE